jgi:hypothetical protein
MVEATEKSHDLPDLAIGHDRFGTDAVWLMFLTGARDPSMSVIESIESGLSQLKIG